ncbi:MULTISPECIES: thiol reductant ABC exporter subunit CydD [Brochothrix]|uniref:Thiol reductant ABC exporter subunit CydD n=1 Tax=Brochothrix thermosphacta TaxID=2756 RepID=A0A1D2KGK7_BROTH|nr:MULTISPECIES: thiol reductant ABC exporter subunit CydD [Brochothrix]ATF25996.1 thiol reductant ABC exporter subunit CydD [Brochothrix thermosphacta]MBR5526002.1 thiol reductant ABC exporter subunit CydD [Brochothrix sp.]MPQ28990.1 thiol reductant ABC exporter subunit CydD [Brochothrix thermosphacta]ODJ56382.1 thiol reductant ABC exporter subunit CydD [Brochothrix thermosphacta]ODJ56754.1 thiol reductant ABC exporter subunit CydD [Brochothrix thermosphacta]
MDKSLFKYKGFKIVMVALMILSIIQGFSIIMQAIYLAGSLSDLFAGHSFQEVRGQLLGFLIMIAVRYLITAVKSRIAYLFAAKTGTAYREAVIEKLFQLGSGFLSQMGSGQTVTLMMEGIAKFRRYLELFIPKFSSMAVIPLMIGIYMLFVDLKSAIVLGVTFVILICFMILLGWAAQKNADAKWESYEKLSNHFVDSLRGIETLRYLGISRRHEKQIAFVSENYRKSTMSTLRVAFLSSFALDFFTMLGVATIAVFLGVQLIDGTMMLYPALLSLILAPEFFLPVREIGTDFHASLDGQEAGKALQEVLDIPVSHETSSTIKEWSTDSELILNGVVIKGEEERERLRIDKKIELSGVSNIGVIGASGSGKSTFVSLLGGFLEAQAGDIQVNKQDISSLAQTAWREQVTFIPQHPYIFNLSLRENIRFYRPTATEAEVIEAAERAGLNDLIDSLEFGLDAFVGESGRQMSGGQEQRVALARAYIEERPVMLLDEPTAHLDIETESELKETMLPLFENKLVVLATHRLHWMNEMDWVIVLDKGQVVEQGLPHELFAKKGTYYQLVQAQLGA